MAPPSGGVVLWKPRGLSSRAALEQAERQLGVRRLGHTGTLDPLASGLLILLGGEARKFQNLFTRHHKEYVGQVVFGMRSHSDDGEGPLYSVVPRPEPPERALVEDVVESFVGEYRHVPPRFSAVRIDGERAYRRARRGEMTEPEARQVQLHTLEILDWSAPSLELRVECEAGTYIRSLARDLGEKLGVGAYLAGLRRTRVGEFKETDAQRLEDLNRDSWISIEELLRHERRLDLESPAAHRLSQGQRIPRPVPAEGDPLPDGVCVIWCEGRVRGLGEVTGGEVRARRWLSMD